jgi:hypothetical protein
LPKSRPVGHAARDHGGEREDQRGAAEAREQKEIGVGIRRDRAGDHETGRPQHDEHSGNEGSEHRNG